MQFKYFIIFVFLFCLLEVSAQVKQEQVSFPIKERTTVKDTSINKKAKGYKKVATIDMYLQFNSEIDSVIVDTTLTISKDYNFNYLQRDNFGLMPFANIGQTYNSLTFNSLNTNILPLFAGRARHFNYMEEEDIRYYEVPTPWTRLTYKTAFEQGQMLDAFFTVNLSKQFNFSLGYKGLRSLGNYQNVLTSSGNFRFTTNYKSKNGKYKAQGHVVMQDLLNQENGGLKDEDVENFESGIEEFLDRSVFDLNLDDAENILEGKRFYLNHSYDLVKMKDSLKENTISIVNIISYEDKYYQFYQSSPSNDFFGNSFTNNINDKVTLEDYNTEVGLKYSNNIIGDLKFGIDYTNINYGYNSIILLEDELIPNRIKTDFFGLSASYSNKIGRFRLNSKAAINLSDEIRGNYIDAKLSINLNEDITLQTGFNLNSKLPNYNHLLYQSDYLTYNWNNQNVFENINTQQINFNFKSQKILNVSFDISNINNHTYFKLNEDTNGVKVIKPAQYKDPLQYMRLKIQKEFKLGNFALENTIMYQNVISDEEVLNVPSIISRNTLYYSNQLFKKAMTLQTGITLNYFTKYNMDGYDPLLAEFFTQNETELGGFPRLDFFINAKIRQTRIFLKAEHFNSSMTGYNYFSAPNHPYRDFTIRFGLVWDFFL